MANQENQLVIEKVKLVLQIHIKYQLQKKKRERKKTSNLIQNSHQSIPNSNKNL